MKAQEPQNPIYNLLINILLPVMILNKGSHYLDPKWTLLLALLFPLGYGLHDYLKNRHKNYVSLIGLFNILLTGGLALMHLEGFWFAVKEASLPFVLGLIVLFSAWTENPAAKMMFCNPQILHLELIETRLTATGRTSEFSGLLKYTTLWLSTSFFISALMNFALAVWIFKDIDPNLEASARELILNEQIAKMTWMGFAVIALPLMIFSGILVYMFLKRLSAMTGESLESLLKS